MTTKKTSLLPRRWSIVAREALWIVAWVAVSFWVLDRLIQRQAVSQGLAIATWLIIILACLHHALTLTFVIYEWHTDGERVSCRCVGSARPIVFRLAEVQDVVARNLAWHVHLEHQPTLWISPRFLKSHDSLLNLLQQRPPKAYDRFAKPSSASQQLMTVFAAGALVFFLGGVLLLGVVLMAAGRAAHVAHDLQRVFLPTGLALALVALAGIVFIFTRCIRACRPTAKSSPSRTTKP